MKIRTLVKINSETSKQATKLMTNSAVNKAQNPERSYSRSK